MAWGFPSRLYRAFHPEVVGFEPCLPLRRLVGLREVDLVEVIDIAALGVIGEKMV